MLRAEAFAEADELRRELDRERLDASGLIRSTDFTKTLYKHPSPAAQNRL
jgi:hypothetical protein